MAGKAPKLSKRDEEVFRDLYTARCLSQDQFCKMPLDEDRQSGGPNDKEPTDND